MLRNCLLTACLGLMACVELPEVAEPIPPSGTGPDYPDLVNLNTLELTAEEDDTAALVSEAAVEARISRLNSKAATLRAAAIN